MQIKLPFHKQISESFHIQDFSLPITYKLI